MQEFFHRLGLPEIASAHGAALDAMNVFIHWFMLSLFVGWGAFFIYVLWRFRAKKNPRGNYEGTKGHLSSYVEGAVVIVEVVLLIGFAIPLWAERVNEFPEDADAHVIRVVAEQFAWNTHYAGPDGIFGKTDPTLINKQSNPLGLDKNDPNALDDFSTINQTHLPVGKPTIIHLSSKDVIHSFGVPEFRVKQDAIPGASIPMWFTPTITTKEMRAKKGKPEWNYEIACAQLCGIGHYRMRGYVTVHSQTEYDEWASTQEPTLTVGDEDDEFWG